MKIININKVIKEIEAEKDYNEYGFHYKYGLEKAIQIIKDNIKKDDRENYEQIDHYYQWF